MVVSDCEKSRITMIFIVASLLVTLHFLDAPGVSGAIQTNWNEADCVQQGGMCVPSSECPSGQQGVAGLCPAQQEYGVECCYGLPANERRCERRAGECTAKFQCPPAVRIPIATDCPRHEVCCGLTRIKPSPIK